MTKRKEVLITSEENHGKYETYECYVARVLASASKMEASYRLYQLSSMGGPIADQTHEPASWLRTAAKMADSEPRMSPSGGPEVDVVERMALELRDLHAKVNALRAKERRMDEIVVRVKAASLMLKEFGDDEFDISVVKTLLKITEES